MRRVHILAEANKQNIDVKDLAEFDNAQDYNSVSGPAVIVQSVDGANKRKSVAESS